MAVKSHHFAPYPFSIFDPPSRDARKIKWVPPYTFGDPVQAVVSVNRFRMASGLRLYGLVAVVTDLPRSCPGPDLLV